MDLSEIKINHQIILSKLNSILDLISANDNFNLVNLRELFSFNPNKIVLQFYFIIEEILLDGISVFLDNGNPNISQIINYIETYSATSKSLKNVPFESDILLHWITVNLQNLTLSQKIKKLIINTENLNEFYETTAFLNNEYCANATILCLEIMENHLRALSLSTNINTTKRERAKSLTKNLDYQINETQLKRTKSLPNIPLNLIKCQSRIISNPIEIPHASGNIQIKPPSVPSFSYKTIQSDSGGSSETPTILKNDLRPITLVKCDDIEIYLDRKFSSPKSTASFQESCDITNSDMSTTPNNSKSNAIKSSKKKPWSIIPFFDHNDDEIEEGQIWNTKSIFSKSAPSDFVGEFIPKSGIKLRSPQHSNLSLSDDTNNGLPQSCGTGYFPRPVRGQSLASFLQTAQFSRTNTEIDRENAHFSVAEAVISAIEQIKWMKYEKRSAENEKSEESKKSFKRRKRQRNEIEKNEQCDTPQESYSSKISNNENTSSVPTSPSSSFDSAEIVSINSSNLLNEPTTSSNNNDIASLSNSSQNTNDHTAYAEWGENHTDGLSAEGVALSLISKFSDKHLPKASDLLWLVSEQDAPQQLLPMPGSFIVNPDDSHFSFLRGTRDWAPPRAQIIFTRHPSPDRKKIMNNQRQRCAGCGMRVSSAFSHLYRYCEYLGKYHCTGCHRNQMSPIPARVISNWDFAHRPVSVFSYRLLNQIWSLPLFRIYDLNPKICDKIKMLKLAHDKRIKLKHINSFIMTCRFAAENFKSIFENISSHLIDDLEIWSMADFVSIRKGHFTKIINNIIATCEEHILKCELCLARGFVCELCTKKQIIFPWQKKIKRCNKCGMCYHEKCFKNECTKCLRLEKRLN